MRSNNGITRRDWLRGAIAVGALAASGAGMSAPTPIKRAIPSSGELLPVIGLGTYQTFDAGSTPSERAPLREVLREFVDLGGSMLDSSPMYGRSEEVAGDLAAELGVQKKLFHATKIWTSGREGGLAQMERSFRRMRVAHMDLMQIHNLVDWRTHLATLREWKQQGKIRYLGVTHYTDSAYDELERVLNAEALDFVQLNFSIVERAAEKRLLPLAMERRVAVIANRPFAQAGLFSKVRGKDLPPWAEEFDCDSWAQFFLKFIVSHSAITCVIPATGNVKHLRENMYAGTGRLPDATMRERMARHVASL